MEEIEETKKKIASPDYPNSIEEKFRKFSPEKRKLLDSVRPELLGISNTTGYNRNLKLKKINDTIESPESKELKQRLKSLKIKPSNNPEKPEKTDEREIADETKVFFCRDKNCNGLLILGKCIRCGRYRRRTGKERRTTISKAPEFKERKIGGEKK